MYYILSTHSSYADLTYTNIHTFDVSMQYLIRVHIRYTIQQLLHIALDMMLSKILLYDQK